MSDLLYIRKTKFLQLCFYWGQTLATSGVRRHTFNGFKPRKFITVVLGVSHWQPGVTSENNDSKLCDQPGWSFFSWMFYSLQSDLKGLKNENLFSLFCHTQQTPGIL